MHIGCDEFTDHFRLFGDNDEQESKAFVNFLIKYVGCIKMSADNSFVLTALSVEIRTNRSAPYLSAHFAVLYVPNTLFFIASAGENSIKGTCLCAAAWKTYLGR